MTLELSLAEIRDAAAYAVACARPALAIFERECPDDGRPRAAIDAAHAFAAGERRTEALRGGGFGAAPGAAQETRDSGQAAASDACALRRQYGRCRLYPSTGESHSGEAHIRIGRPRGAGLGTNAGEDPTLAADHIARARLLANPVVVDVLRRSPPRHRVVAGLVS